MIEPEQNWDESTVPAKPRIESVTWDGCDFKFIATNTKRPPPGFNKARRPPPPPSPSSSVVSVDSHGKRNLKRGPRRRLHQRRPSPRWTVRRRRKRQRKPRRPNKHRRRRPRRRPSLLPRKHLSLPGQINQPRGPWHRPGGGLPITCSEVDSEGATFPRLPGRCDQRPG